MLYTNWLRWGVISGLFATLVVPFLVADGNIVPAFFFPFITGKNFAFRLLVEIALGLYVLLALREPKYRPKSSVIGWAALAFVVWMGIANVFSVEPIKSFWSNFERMEGYVGLLHLYAFFLLAGAMLSAENLWQRFFNTSIAASAMMGFYALLQVFGALAISTQSGLRVDTTFGNATYLAVYMLIHLFLTIYMLAQYYSKAEKGVGIPMLYGAALVLQGVALYYTETRGAILGAVGGLLVMALYLALFARAREWRVARTRALWAIGAIVLLGAGFFAVKDTQFIRESPALGRLASISLEDNTTKARFMVWNMALQGFAERPVTGWGQENFSYVFNTHYTPEMYGQEAWFDRAHNQFLDWLIAGGLPAFVLYVGLYALLVLVFFRSGNLSVAERAALIGLLAGYTFNNLFVFDNLVSAMYFFVLLAFAHSLSKNQLPAWLPLTKPAGDHAVAIAAPAVAIVFLVGGWALNMPSMVRAANIIPAVQTAEETVNAQGVSTRGAKDPQKNLAEFKEAFAGGPWPSGGIGRQEVVEQLLQYATNSIAPSAVGPETKEQIFSYAYESAKMLLAERKNDARLELFMATFLTQVGRYDEAISYLNAALTHSPDKQQILYQLGVTHVQKGDFPSALATFKKAYDLAPENDVARILYAAGYYYNGEQAAGDALLTERFGSVIVDNNTLLQIYTNTKQYQRAVDIWKLRIEADPKNIDLHMSLASAYFTAGRLEETIQVLRDIAALDPNKALEMQNIITQIQNGTLKP